MRSASAAAAPDWASVLRKRRYSSVGAPSDARNPVRFSGPIAHCAPLAEDEVVRLRLSVRDWFRLMQ
jgi:hypothetical protein